MPPLTEFVQQLIAEQGFTRPIDPEVMEQLEADLSSGAIDLINRRLIDAMPEQTVSHFNALLDSDPSPQAVQAFVEHNVPNLEYVTVQALLEFRQFYLGDKA